MDIAVEDHDWLFICRDGSDWLFDELHKHNVPLLIFSAGVGDVVVEAVKQRAVLHDNVKVVSNFMDFDNEVLWSAFGLGRYFTPMNLIVGVIVNWVTR